jgi:hypothetical protein
MKVRPFALGILAAAACHSTPRKAEPQPRDLTTEGERSGWARTGRYDEAVRLCGDFAATFPGRVRCETFGTTPELRPMVALVVGNPDRPVLLVQGGIHAGEIEGKDAGFWFLRDLLEGKVLPGALDAVSIVFIPVFNADGHERFGANHRPNQRGPEEMGMRSTAQNLNLNRDHLKVDAPEMTAQLGLWKTFDPVLYVDLHTTDGAKFQHDISVLVSPRSERGDGLDEVGRALSDAIQARMEELGHLPLDFYPAFVEDDDPASGFATGDLPPRFSNAYAAERNRLGVLVETHSWRTYPERVKATYHVLQTIVERAVADGAAWRTAVDEADLAGARLGGAEVVLGWRAGDEVRTIDFLGYAYERRPSEVSGGIWTVYDESRPEVWKVPMRDRLEPGLTVTAPAGGYVVEAGFAADVAARLDAHGLSYETLDAAVTADVEVFRAESVSFQPSYEGRAPARVTGAWKGERRELRPGALWIPIAQPRARLLLHMFEPTAPDALVGWGFFNAVFEQKEYMEGYVTEEVARAMLADPEVKATFDKALEDPEVAKSPHRRREFFYRRHPSWDGRKDLLPVMRLAGPLR